MFEFVSGVAACSASPTSGREMLDTFRAFLSARGFTATNAVVMKFIKVAQAGIENQNSQQSDPGTVRIAGLR